MKLRQGSIIRVENVLDERGLNPKPRRMILITPTEAIETAETLCFVCITSRFDKPIPDDCVPLPFRNGQPHPTTKLALPSVAVCRWLYSMPNAAPLPEPSGFCPSTTLAAILIRTAQLQNPAIADATAKTSFVPESDS